MAFNTQPPFDFRSRLESWNIFWIESLNLIFSNLFFLGWQMGFYIQKKPSTFGALYALSTTNLQDPSIHLWIFEYFPQPIQLHTLHTLEGKKPQQKLHPHLVRAFLGIGGSQDRSVPRVTDRSVTVFCWFGFGRKPFFWANAAGFRCTFWGRPKGGRLGCFCWEAMFKWKLHIHVIWN